MKGNVILEKKPKSTIVYDETAAYVMVDMLKSVVSESGGTAVGLWSAAKRENAHSG